MNLIQIECGGCNQSFEFRHPSVKSAKDLANVTIDCTHCGVTLKAPSDRIRMEPISDFMTRRLAQLGVEVNPSREVGYIEL